MEAITSTRNPRVRELAQLTRARIRRERGLHLVEGPHAVAEALAAGVVRELLLAPGGATALGGRPDVPVTEVSAAVLERLADTRTPQGVLAVAVTSTVTPLAALAGFLTLVLDNVADPGNAGTVLRTADAAGATGVVVLSGSVDVFGPKALRAAAGSTYHLPVAVDVAADELLEAAGARGVLLLGLDAAGDLDVLADELPAGALALVLGNEAHGLSPAVARCLHGTVRVPIRGHAESLNVSAAAAVALYAVAGRAASPGVAR